jgi:tetratricopeptide (TPR) repeat protein
MALFFMAPNLTWAQKQYISPDDIKLEWKNHTSFQRQELVNFAKFLYDEGFYERALISYFQYLYRYPKDELEMATYFQIGKCYELLESWDLAKNYYKRIIDENPSEPVSKNAAQYQLLYISLVNQKYEEVIDSTNNSKDPYELIFRAYAHFELLDWTKSRQAFKTAEALFNHSHYSKQIRPWYKAIKTAQNAPLKERKPALLASIAPGGGFVYLKQTENAIGAISASLFLYAAMFSMPVIFQKGELRISENRQNVVPISGDLVIKNSMFHSAAGYQMPYELTLKTSKRTVLIPPALIALGLYTGSMWKAAHDIDMSNRRLVKRYTGRVTTKLSIERFMDFNTPDLIIK